MTNNNNSKPPRRWWLALIPLLLGPLIYFGVTILLRTPDGGSVRIESQVDDVQLELVDEKDVVTKLQVSQSGKETEVKVGRYRVRIAGDADGIQVNPNEIVVQKGTTAIASVTQESDQPEIARSTEEASDGWTDPRDEAWASETASASHPAAELNPALAQQLAQITIALNTAREKYGPRHPKVRELEDRAEIVSAFATRNRSLTAPPAASSDRVLEVYTLRGDTNAVSKTIEALMPGIIVNTTQTQIHALATDSQHEALKSLLQKLDPAPAQSSESVAANKVLELRLQLDEARKTYGEGHSKVQQLKSQLEVAEKLAAGVPTEPVYKGKPLRHWEAILKYETLLNERREASAAVMALFDNVPLNRKIELLIHCYAVDIRHSRGVVRMADGGATQQLMIPFRLLKEIEPDGDLLQLLKANLRNERLCEATVLVLASARYQLKRKPEWKPVIDAAYEQRGRLTAETQVYLAEMLPDDLAVEYAETFEDQLSHDALHTLTLSAKRGFIALSREKLLHLAGRCFLNHVKDKSVSALFPEGPVDSWTDQQTSDAIAYTKPIIASYQSHSRNTTTSFELDWLYDRTELQQVPHGLRPTVSQIFIDSIDRNRRDASPIRALVLRAARAVVLLTGKLPPNLRVGDPQKLPDEINRMLSATRRDQFDIDTLASFPIESLEQLPSMSETQLGHVFSKHNVVSSVARLELPPALALAILADESIPAAARKATSLWLFEIARVGGGEAAQLRKDVSNHEKLQSLLIQWFDREPSYESEVVLSSVGPNTRLKQHLLEKLRTPTDPLLFRWVTEAFAYWRDQLDRKDFKAAVALANKAPARFFPSNALAQYRPAGYGQAIGFLRELDDFKELCDKKIQSTKPGTTEHTTAQKAFAIHLVNALAIANHAPRNQALRQLAAELRTRLEESQFNVPQKQTALKLLKDIETGDPPAKE